MSNTRFDWSKADRLGQLECLEVLKLKKDAFTGKSWKPEIGGFSQLQLLWIEIADLEYWEASRLHFPRLRRFVIWGCPKFASVPVELSQFHDSSYR